MRWSKQGILLSITWLLLACAPARIDDAPVGPDPDAAPLLDYIDQAVGTERFRGAVEVRRGEKVVLRRGFGFADPANGVSNGPNTRFHIGSVTKQFTALAVLVLQEQGKLVVANNVCSYLPNCPPQWAPITIEQLLTHTSGLHNYFDGSATVDQFAAAAGSGQPTPDQLIGLFAALPLDFPPGTKWLYSNSGYVVLGKLIEQVSGQSYGDFLREKVLDPVGMSDTGYESGVTGKEYAVGYDDWTTPSAVFDDSVYYAAGGMYSTVTDLGRWQRFLLTDDPPVIRADTLAEMLRPRVVESPGRWYGYGVESRGATTSTIDMIGHSGGLAGFNSYVEAHPATGLTITVLANIGLDAEQFGRTLAELVPKPQ
jgi:CubicO group peptidase (beta-lactamase class C family)